MFCAQKAKCNKFLSLLLFILIANYLFVCFWAIKCTEFYLVDLYFYEENHLTTLCRCLCILLSFKSSFLHEVIFSKILYLQNSALIVIFWSKNSLLLNWFPVKTNNPSLKPTINVSKSFPFDIVIGKKTFFWKESNV